MEVQLYRLERNMAGTEIKTEYKTSLPTVAPDEKSE